jgi:ssDNA-binding Zn-finger/Zn-ribbon topoisomerase 1
MKMIDIEKDKVKAVCYISGFNTLHLTDKVICPICKTTLGIYGTYLRDTKQNCPNCKTFLEGLVVSGYVY